MHHPFPRNETPLISSRMIDENVERREARVEFYQVIGLCCGLCTKGNDRARCFVFGGRIKGEIWNFLTKGTKASVEFTTLFFFQCKLFIHSILCTAIKFKKILFYHLEVAIKGKSLSLLVLNEGEASVLSPIWISNDNIDSYFLQPGHAYILLIV